MTNLLLLFIWAPLFFIAFGDMRTSTSLAFWLSFAPWMLIGWILICLPPRELPAKPFPFTVPGGHGLHPDH